MSVPITTELADRVAEWVRRRADEMHVSVTLYPEGIVRQGDWLNVPASVNEKGDAYDRASLLQQIEDAWDPAAQQGLNLLLVPAGRVTSTKDLYAEYGDLMTRQSQLLDRMGEQGITPEDAERLQAVRHETEQHLRRMEQLHLSLRSEVA